MKTSFKGNFAGFSSQETFFKYGSMQFVNVCEGGHFKIICEQILLQFDLQLYRSTVRQNIPLLSVVSTLRKEIVEQHVIRNSMSVNIGALFVTI